MRIVFLFLLSHGSVTNPVTLSAESGMTVESLEWPAHRADHETHPPEKERLMGPVGFSCMRMKSSSPGRESGGRSGSLK